MNACFPTPGPSAIALSKSSEEFDRAIPLGTGSYVGRGNQELPVR